MMGEPVARQNWSNSTFEVLTNSGKRWLIDMSSSRRSEAMDYAEKLLLAGKHSGVRVTELREGWAKERVVFEQSDLGREKPLKINLEPEATFCTTLDQYYELPARLTMGRIMRAYLDKNNITILELLFHAGHLRALDRMDTFYPAALQHGAQLQAKLTGQTKLERMDKLQTVFDKVLKRARKDDDLLAYGDYLARHDLDAALALIETEVDAKQAARTIYGMLAYHIEGGGWREKFRRAVELAEAAKSEQALNLADELIAEILDGKAAIEELFGGFFTPVKAWKTYVQIISGRFLTVPSHMSPDIARLNALFDQHALSATREVLLRRVSKGLGSTQALSKDGRNEDRIAFIGLMRDLVEPTGLCGGPAMAEAMILRAKTLLGENGEDLPIDTAIRQALYLMPSQAVRLGVLVDLTSSELGQKYDGVIRQQLLLLLDALRSIYDLFPQDVHEDERLRGIDALRERLGMSVMGDDLKSSLSASLSKLSKMPNDAAAESEPSSEQRTTSSEGDLNLKPGEVLFEEGELGDAAYLIVEGTIQISRLHNGKSVPLATVRRGEIIGEMSLIDHQPRMASAVAVEACKLVRISDKNLQERMSKLAESDQVLHFLIKTLVRRLRGLARNTE